MSFLKNYFLALKSSLSDSRIFKSLFLTLIMYFFLIIILVSFIGLTVSEVLSFLVGYEGSSNILLNPLVLIKDVFSSNPSFFITAPLVFVGLYFLVGLFFKSFIWKINVKSSWSFVYFLKFVFLRASFLIISLIITLLIFFFTNGTLTIVLSIIVFLLLSHYFFLSLFYLSKSNKIGSSLRGIREDFVMLIKLLPTYLFFLLLLVIFVVLFFFGLKFFSPDVLPTVSSIVSNPPVIIDYVYSFISISLYSFFLWILYSSFIRVFFTDALNISLSIPQKVINSRS
ncbi:hypothetical protein COU61_00900 [Candidatus Pacearchaeota archaeon CG10_big_fil_rev_8_21_14_0_10_35_13]|nr:MAG: hypothetical protein COU61_00900 [Candidatus Pacearchaeota archaeon CG10_big_fil_rev_8_21_14_0_10_35_13]